MNRFNFVVVDDDDVVVVIVCVGILDKLLPWLYVCFFTFGESPEGF